MQQSQQCYITENKNCGDEDLDDTNRIENSFINENRQYFESSKSSGLIIKLKVTTNLICKLSKILYLIYLQFCFYQDLSVFVF